jgi:SPP1 family predicted phage head-tail adaptor
MPAAGRLDETYEFLRATTVQDEFGQPIETYTVWRVAKGGRRDTRADERFRANQELATETAVIVFHFMDGTSPKDRLRRVSDGRLYDILGIAEMGRRSGLEITAAARIDG